MTTSGTSASAATSIARSTLPIGSVPHTLRVRSRHGAWIAPIVRPCSAASARMRTGSWLAGSFVTITSAPSYPVSASRRNVWESGRAKNAADENTILGEGIPPL